GELLHLQKEARALGATLDTVEAKRIVEARILEESLALSVAPRRETALALIAYLELADELGLAPQVWEAQNLYWTLLHEGPRGPDADPELLVRLGVRLGFDEACLDKAWRVRDVHQPAMSGA